MRSTRCMGTNHFTIILRMELMRFVILAVTEADFRPDMGVNDTQYELMKDRWGWKI